MHGFAYLDGLKSCLDGGSVVTTLKIEDLRKTTSRRRNQLSSLRLCEEEVNFRKATPARRLLCKDIFEHNTKYTKLAAFAHSTYIHTMVGVYLFLMSPFV